MNALTRCVTAAIVLLLWTVSAAWSQGLPTAAPEAVGLSSERLERLDAHLRRQVEQGGLPGGVALVARHGRTAYFEDFGTLAGTASSGDGRDAIFRLASMTKPIVSVAVLMLYEEGAFLLRDPLSKYLPSFAEPEVLVEVDLTDTTYTAEPARREITIRDLLTHTSGIAYGSYHERLGPLYAKADVPDAWDTRPITLADKMPVLASLPLAHHPGEAWTYGLSVDVLGYLVEVVSGVPLDRFLETRVFEPLEMHDTFFYLPDDRAARLAPLYRETDDGFVRYDEDAELRAREFPNSSPDYPVEGARTYFPGGAGLSSTASDYVRFAQMLLNGGALDGVRLLSPKTIALMTTDHLGDLTFTPGHGFGLGVQVRTELGAAGELGSVGTYGWDGYWNTRFWVDPQERLIGIFLSQVGGSSYDKTRLQTLVYQAVVEPAARAAAAFTP